MLNPIERTGPSQYLLFPAILALSGICVLYILGAIPVLPGRVIEILPSSVPLTLVRIFIMFGITAGVIIFFKPQIGVLFILLYVPVQFGLRDKTGGAEAIGLLDDAVMLLLLARICVSIVREKVLIRTPVDGFFLALIVLGILSAIANNVPGVAIIQGLRAPVQPFLFFYIAIYFLRDLRVYKLGILLFLVLAVIQIPVAVSQFDPTSADAVSGTLGVGFHNSFGFYLAISVYLLIGFGLFKKRIRYIVLAITLSVLFVLASARSMYFFMPLSLLFLFRREVINKFQVRIQALVVALLAIGVVMITVFVTTQFVPVRLGEHENWPSLERLWRAQLDPVHSTGRIGWIGLTIDALEERPIVGPLFGLGPLMWGSKPASQQYSEEFRETISKHYGNSVSSQIVVVLGEYGVLGVLLYYLLFIRLTRMKSVIAESESDPYWRAVLFAVEGGILIFALGGFIQSTWFLQVTAYPVWFLLSAAYYRTINRI